MFEFLYFIPLKKMGWKLASTLDFFGHATCTCKSPDSRGASGPRGIWVGGAEITPVKGYHTRIKPFALASGQSRYITVTPERTPVSVGELPLHIAVINL
jgi:hypothetical protein